MTMQTEELGRRLGERLDGIVDHLDVATRPAPPWSQVQRGLRRAVRRRRIRRAGGVFAALASVGALTIGVQNALLPSPRREPVTAAGSTPPSPLAELGTRSPLAALGTRGSLASDALWLKQFRELVAGERWDETGEHWQVGNPDDVDVIYAGDLAGYRVAAIEAPYRWGAVERRQQVWFSGPAGAPVLSMVRAGNQDAGASMVVPLSLMGGQVAAPGQRTGALILTATPRTVTRIGPNVYDAAGRAGALSVVVPPVEPGVYPSLLPVEASGYYSWRLDGETEGRDASWASCGDCAAVGRAVRAGADLAVSDEWLGYFVDQARHRFGIDSSTATATSSVVEVSSGGARPAIGVVLISKVPSGATLVALGSRLGGGDSPFGPGATAYVVPAGQEVVAAWRFGTASQKAVAHVTYGAGAQTPLPLPTRTVLIGDTPDEVQGDSVGLLGPAKAVSAQLVTESGSVLTTATLAGGRGVVTSPLDRGAASVRFLSADGAVLATTPVRRFSLGGAGGEQPLPIG